MGQGPSLDTLLANTFKAAVDRLKDGFQLNDVIPIFSAAVVDIMGIANELVGATGEQKRKFVTDMCVALYNFIDKGPDGTQNRIHIPWVPSMVENYIEAQVLPLAIRMVIEAVCTIWKSKVGA